MVSVRRTQGAGCWALVLCQQKPSRKFLQAWGTGFVLIILPHQLFCSCFVCQFSVYTEDILLGLPFLLAFSSFGQ